jgi:DNA transformation protein
MFGGYGFYADGPMFALIADGDLYFKVDQENIGAFREVGSQPFLYFGNSATPVEMSYWKTPTYDSQEITKWAALGNEAAHRAQRKKKN